MESARSLYKSDIDFEALALQSPDFAKLLNPNRQVDFNDPATVRQLTISLLKRDFGLEIILPQDRLCPPVPNRLNYIIWLQDLLDSTAGTIQRGYNPDRKVLGLDIGTGCCSIYPLLGCKTRSQWKFAATDIDESNIRTAKANVELNNLESRIHILHTDLKDSLFPLETLGHDSLDFTMCNPPFYTSHEEMAASAEAKSHAPSSTCTGAEVEMITAGGEVQFVKRMIDESLQLRDRVKWYTSMLGKLSSVTALVDILMKRGNHNYAVTEFVQGNKTKRWAVAWSWGDMRPAMSIARGIPGFPKHMLPFPADYVFVLPQAKTIDAANAAMDTELASLSWYWTWDQTRSAGVGFARENVWSRQARRKLKLAGQSSVKLSAMPMVVELGVRVQSTLVRGQDQETLQVQVLISWIQGTDSVLFESFCGMLKKKIET
ncbi:hypothetical protein N7520_005594 [Penicillium odoratum]|uniref:uncharacterized protein n=1 Tax=Penicillium odoratum TaxID=1167516 RepID=UPI002548C31A|nr:uncharacterized protein N7520_005594 [Penicillium odoratum]KAJ5758438.1 hypothetical protein N7520_005594 [Penicillium odoratum]